MLEKVAYTTGTDTHKHFHEVGTRHREERYSSLSGYCLGQEGLTCSRRTHQQRTFGDLTTQFGIFLRILQEVHDFLNLLLGTGLTCHILERDTQVAALFVHLSLRLADIEDTASGAHASTAHTAHEEDPECHQDEDRQQVIEQHVEHIVLFAVFKDQVTRECLFLLSLVHKFLYLIDRAELHFHVRILACLLGALVEYITDMLRLHVHLDGTLVFVHHDLRSVAMIHHLLEV